MKSFLLVVFVFLFCQQLFAEGLIDNLRRRDQFAEGFSYAVVPVPYSVPGIGDGLGFAAAVSNVYDTQIDTYAVAIFGDVEGFGVGFTDVYLIPERFYLNFGASYISKASFAINPTRGMKGDEDPDEFNNAELSDSNGAGIDATLTFFERMLDFNISFYTTNAHISSIRDKDGNVLIDTEGSDAERGYTLNAGFLLDLTDDRNDPRKGFRLNISTGIPINVDEDSVENYVVDINTTLYFPVLKYSTVVFNYFHSDSYVVKEGITDRTQIESDYNLYADPSDTKAKTAKEQFIDNVVAENKYGSATSLGGLSRLRSFTSMRFRGAHTRFAGVEFRYNLTDENTPFDIWFIKDVRTSFQLALFHEAGTIADRESELYDVIKHSTGVGLRMVVNSGFVFRLDYATGSEGEEFSMFFDYPWTFM